LINKNKASYSLNKVKPKDSQIKVQSLNIVKNRATLLIRFASMLESNHPFDIYDLEKEEGAINKMTKEIKDNIKILIQIRRKELKNVK